jgi:hypothetical protein
MAAEPSGSDTPRFERLTACMAIDHDDAFPRMADAKEYRQAARFEGSPGAAVSDRVGMRRIARYC